MVAGTRRTVAAAVLPCSLVFDAVRHASADSWDIGLQLYHDLNCFERAEELLLLDQGCYANVFSNLTSANAYMLKIVDFEDPERVDLYLYEDDCRTEGYNPRTLLAGRCERFTGAFWAMFRLRFRSTTCEGNDCSLLKTVRQEYFDSENCVGSVHSSNLYPMQGECMMYFNGSQAFEADPSGANISMIDFAGNYDCDGGMITTYTAYNNDCLNLYQDKNPRSFRWVVDQAARIAAIGSGARRLEPIFGLRALLAVVFLSTTRWHTASR